MRRIVGILPVFLTLICLANPTKAQLPAFSWAKMTQGDPGWFNPISMALDHANGAVYITGSFMNTVDFDPGPGTTLLTSPNSSFDAYIQKLDTNGNFIWAKALTGTSEQFINNITVDASGNVTYSGMAAGTTDFDLGAGTNNINMGTNYHAFVSKINSSGNLIWVKVPQHGGSQSSEINEHYVDLTGNTYSTGKFDGTVDFDPGAGTTSFNSGANSQNFIQKLDASGNFVWAKNVGGTGYETAYSIWVTPAGDVIAVGQSESPTIDLDPGPGTANFPVTSAGAYDLYIQKLNAAGNYVAGCRIGGPGGYVQGKVTADATGNIVVMGYFQGTIDMDPGPGTFNLSMGVSTNIGAFVAKYTPTLGFIWAKGFVGTQDVDAYGGIYTDASSNIYVSGGFVGSCDFDPGPGSHVLNVADVNGYLLKLDPAGNFQWIATKIGTYNYLVDFSIDLDRAIYGCGSFNGTVDFDPQGSTFLLSQPIANDVTSSFKWTLLNPVLAAEDLSLTATTSGRAAILNWEVGNPESWVGFEIHRSSDGQYYAPIHSEAATGLTAYRFLDTDVQPGGIYRYQIKALLPNGATQWSEIREVLIPAVEGDLSCHPNPTTGFLTLHSAQAIGKFTLINALGQVIMDADAGSELQFTVDLRTLPRGMYTLVASGRDAVKLLVE